MILNNVINSIMILLLLAVLFYHRKSFFSFEMEKKHGFIILWSVLTIFSVFYQPTEGDSQSTLELYENYIYSNAEYHLEPFYYRLMDIIPGSYYLWRFVIWGTASLLTILSIRCLKINNNFATIIFITTCLLPIFYYVRNILGLSIMFYAFTRILTFNSNSYKAKVREVIICLFLLIVAYFTHSSMPLYFSIALVAYFIPHSRKCIFILFAIILILFFFSEKLIMFLVNSGIYMEYALYVAEIAFDSDTGHDYNIFGQMLRYFWFLPYIIVILWGLFFKQPASLSNHEFRSQNFFLIFSFILFFGTLSLFGRINSSLYYRLLNSSFFPLAFYASMFLFHKKSSSLGRLCIFFILTYNLIHFCALLKF